MPNNNRLILDVIEYQNGYAFVQATLPGDTPDSCILPTVQAELEAALSYSSALTRKYAAEIRATLPMFTQTRSWLTGYRSKMAIVLLRHARVSR